MGRLIRIGLIPMSYRLRLGFCKRKTRSWRFTSMNCFVSSIEMGMILLSGWKCRQRLGRNSGLSRLDGGAIPDGHGEYFLAASCQQDKRPVAAAFGRGKLLRTTPAGGVEVIAAGLRFPMGFVANAKGDLFASDNQG